MFPTLPSNATASQKMAHPTFDPEILKSLLNSLLEQPNNAEEALMWAVTRSHHDLVKHLLDKGVNPNILDKNDGETLLNKAIEVNEAIGLPRQLIIRSIIEHNANVELASRNGFTPIMTCAVYNYPDAAKLLIEFGADITIRSKEGLTPLMLAASESSCDEKNNSEIIKILIESGADTEDRDSEGSTALMLAASYGYTHNIKQLLDGGADIHARNYKRQTALDIAREEGFDEAIQLLDV